MFIPLCASGGGFFLFIHAVRRCVLLLLGIVTFGWAAAQHPYFYSINDNNGLPSNEVYDMYQDSVGFMWLGTNAGLYRYDGTDFIAIKSSLQKGKAVSHLRRDISGKLWCQNFSGQIFSVSGDSLKVEFDWSSRKANFPVFGFDEKNRIWITTDSGLYCIEPGKKSVFFNIKKHTPSIPELSISDVHSKSGKLYFANRNIVGYVSDANIVVLTKNNRPELLNDNSTTISFHQVENKLYVLSRHQKQNSLWLLQNDSLLWIRDLPATIGRVYSLHNNAGKKLWVGGSNGVLGLDFDMHDLFGGQILFPEQGISKVLQDLEGNLWFSTLQDGIFVVPSTDVWIHKQSNSPLNDSRIRQLAKDENERLFIGYQNGKVSRYDLSSKSAQTISFDNSPTDIQLLFTDTANQRLIVGQNKTWLVDTRTMSAVMAKGISNIKSVAKETDNSFLTGSVIASFTAKINPQSTITTTFRKKRTRAVHYEYAAHRKWIAYIDGLWVIDSTGEREIKYQERTISTTDIAELADGSVWVATFDQGVLGFKDAVCFAQYNSEIPNGFVRKIAADGNTLWIAAEDKLIHYRLANKTVASYNRFDGLPSLEIADIEFIGNKILIATPKGLIEIPRQFNSINYITPTVFISGFAVHEKDTTLSSAYKLNYADNNIRISFKGLAFRSQGQFTYKYRLLGLDSSWITTNSQSNVARFPSLPAGKYLFEVKALNEDGIASKTSAVISITILKPSWQKWWFYALCGLTLVVLVSFLFVLRIRQIRRRNELEKRMVNSQLSALKSQMNPHFMFNALNSIQDLVLQQDTTNAQLYLGKFSELTRAVLDASGEEFVSLQKEIDMLSLYLDLEKLRFGNEFTYTLKTENINDADEVQLPSMIIQPFVENALKHGLLHKQGEKKLHLDFKIAHHKLICTVDDNGIGRKASGEINARKKKHKSFATQATAERLRLLNEYYKLNINLVITDKQDGTKVIIEIPLQE